MIIKNNLKKDFSIIPNALITDQDLSAEAKIIYAYIATKPETWVVRHSDVQNELRIASRSSMAKYTRELIDAGWVTRSLRNGESGSFNGGYDYELHSSKQVVKKPTDVSKNGRTGVLKNGRTDVSKNGHKVCPKNALSQKMDTSNTEGNRVIDNRVSNTDSTATANWTSLAEQLQVNLTPNIQMALTELANSPAFTDKPVNAIRSTLVKIRMFQTEYSDTDIAKAILYSAERNLDYVATPMVSKKTNENNFGGPQDFIPDADFFLTTKPNVLGGEHA